LVGDENPVIIFSKDLSCGACVIGGYVFAYRGSQDWNCCEVADSACWSGYTKRSNLGDYTDRFQQLYTFCDNSAVRPRACGPPKVYHVSPQGNDTTLDVSAMNLADSCTFKVFANCSYPTFTVNSTDVNVLVASFKGKNETSDDASNSTLKWAPKSNGKTVATVADD